MISEIPEYIRDWLTIIEQMSNDNTYKLAWGRAVVECVALENYTESDGTAVIRFDDIALNMLKYYWNQLFFFHLKQSPYKDKDPIICRDTEKLIEIYKNVSSNQFPVWFDKATAELEKNNKPAFDATVKHISKTLHENVSWRFKNVPNRVIDIYEYHKSNSTITLDIEEALLLKEYSAVISKLLNYKWAQLLEKFNFAPKIASKVNSIANAKLKRNSLAKYKDELLKEFENKNITDFYTGQQLSSSEISVDHVIPWSYMYSDDIWNLVITSRRNNSSKSNAIPSGEAIAKLKERNKIIEPLLSPSFRITMEEAIKNNYVAKFYYESRL